MSESAATVVARTHRAHWGRLLSLLVARSRRLDLAEEALAEAFARATERWPADGVPANPCGWLHTTASRLIVAQLRTESIRGRAAQRIAIRPDEWSPDTADRLAGVGTDGRPAGADHADGAVGLGDERLAMILLCCHPAIRPESRAALALRLVVGTSTDDIARLFLTSTPTMAARLTRAKKKIVVAGIPLSRPVGDELDRRLHDVCRTIYLAFTAGYTPATGPDLLRVDLAGDAVELATVLHRLVPSSPAVAGLSGLVRLQHARRDARVRDGVLIPLAEQDRSRWNADELEPARALVASIPSGTGYAETLRLQALIAAAHADAGSADDTDWERIHEHYLALERLTASPIVRLNRAVVVAEIDGAAAGLQLLTELDEPLGRHHRLHAVRADLARRADDVELARRSYRLAIDACANEVERSFLLGRLGELDDGAG
ncbi:MAG: DUF6596 domain-containing protein [Actinomycetota bacterium]